jgi:hypothetical protein
MSESDNDSNIAPVAQEAVVAVKKPNLSSNTIKAMVLFVLS